MKTKEKPVTLLPCPFCGQTPDGLRIRVDQLSPEGTSALIRCDNCGSSTDAYYHWNIRKSAEVAATAWNRRAPQTQQKEENESN